MARGVNKVILIGNLGADPDIRTTTTQKQVANLSIATSEQWTDKNTGQKQEKTEWHRVVMFDRLAEIAGQYLKKGSKVYIEGKLQTRKWQNQQGVDQYTTEIVASELQMLDGANGGAGQSIAEQQAQAYAQPQPQQRQQPQPHPSQHPAPVAHSPHGHAYNPGFAPAAQPAPAAGGFGDLDAEIPF